MITIRYFPSRYWLKKDHYVDAIEINYNNLQEEIETYI